MNFTQANEGRQARSLLSLPPMKSSEMIPSSLQLLRECGITVFLTRVTSSRIQRPS
jgi:hypothetical protein